MKGLLQRKRFVNEAVATDTDLQDVIKTIIDKQNDTKEKFSAVCYVDDRKISIVITAKKKDLCYYSLVCKSDKNTYDDEFVCADLELLRVFHLIHDDIMAHLKKEAPEFVKHRINP